jgi:hypothetical protein
VSKRLFYGSLEGSIEKGFGTELLHEPKTSFSCIMGNIIKDEGDIFVDDISVQKNADLLNIRTPKDMKFDRGDSEVLLKHLKHNICRSTPYADYNAGIFFPSPSLTKPPPNSILHHIKGREESTVVGNFVLGNGYEITFPEKEKGDFRLQFPGGWCLYVKENGDTYMQLLDTPMSIPTPDSEKPYVEFLADGSFTLNFANGIMIKFGDGCIELHSDEDTNIKLCKDEIEINRAEGNLIKMDSSGNIEITGTSVKLQGGGNNLSHADHTHGYQHTHASGNLGVPIPPQTHIGPGINTDTHLPIQGTTTTEAE